MSKKSTNIFASCFENPKKKINAFLEDAKTGQKSNFAKKIFDGLRDTDVDI